MTAPGVGVCESVSVNRGGWGDTPPRTPYVTLLAIDGDRIAREETFTDTRSLPPRKPPVESCGSPPGPRDTARAAAAAGAAVGDAFAHGDPAALRAVVAPDVLFYDTAQAHGEREGGPLSCAGGRTCPTWSSATSSRSRGRVGGRPLDRPPGARDRRGEDHAGGDGDGDARPQDRPHDPVLRVAGRPPADAR